jgi:hypothetical protein
MAFNRRLAVSRLTFLPNVFSILAAIAALRFVLVHPSGNFSPLALVQARMPAPPFSLQYPVYSSVFPLVKPEGNR